VKFLKGAQNKPRDDHGVVAFALGRAPVGGGSWDPRYPAAFLKPALGVVTGAHQAMGIANVLKDEVIRRLGVEEPEKKYTEEDCGVPSHAPWYGQGKGRHVYT
jgi:hypothetical protein